VTDIRLWVLSRRSFLAAVTGHGEAAAIADAVVAERLAAPWLGDPAAAVAPEPADGPSFPSA
jgi:hypothetical protein